VCWFKIGFPSGFTGQNCPTGQHKQCSERCVKFGG